MATPRITNAALEVGAHYFPGNPRITNAALEVGAHYFPGNPRITNYVLEVGVNLHITSESVTFLCWL